MVAGDRCGPVCPMVPAGAGQETIAPGCAIQYPGFGVRIRSLRRGPGDADAAQPGLHASPYLIIHRRSGRRGRRRKHTGANMPESIQRPARLLIVDDQAANIRLLECTLQEIAGLTLVTTTDSTQALPLYLAVRPDAIVLDLRMPGLDGFAILEQLRPLVPANDYLPILVISADITPDAKLRALALGATEFLSKPYNPREVELR